jgi:hypothetical protein
MNENASVNIIYSLLDVQSWTLDVQIAPVIAEQLAKLYPDDQATGFLEGELRGWFWVEMH